ncbi:hypothetical protein Tco_1346814 [Tanacetum coccineum]
MLLLIAGVPHFDYQCQLINETYMKPNPSYDSSGFDQPQPPQDFVDSHGILQALNKMQEELEEIKQDRRKRKKDMSIEEMRHEQQLVDYKIKDITNDLGYKRFRGEKIDEEYERDCDIRIRKLKQDFNEWGSEDDYIPLGDIIARYSTSKTITPVLPIEKPDNSLSMGDEHLDTTSSIKILVPIPSDLEGISEDTCDVPVCDDLLFLMLLNIRSEILSDSNNDDTSSDDDDFEDVEYVSLEEVNDDQEEKEFDLEDIFQIQDIILSSGKLLNERKRTRSCSTTTHANYSLPEYDSFLFEIEPDQGGLTSIAMNNNSTNDPLLELPEFESFHFDQSFPRPPPEPPDEKVRLIFLKMLKMMIPSHLSFGLFFRFSSTPRFLLYLAPPGVKIRSLTPASPLRAGGISSGRDFHDNPDFKDSRALGFVHLFELHILSFI